MREKGFDSGADKIVEKVLGAASGCVNTRFRERPLAIFVNPARAIVRLLNPVAMQVQTNAAQEIVEGMSDRVPI